MLNLPLASDFFPHGDVAARYGILREGDPLPGVSERAIFVVDKQGKIAFAKLYPLNRAPEPDEIIDALKKL
jgi:peroxiredoxin